MMKKTAIALAALAALILPGTALASAWTQEAGKGQVIVTGVYSNSTKGYDGNGDTIDISDYEKLEAYALIEYGVTDDLTLMVNPSFRHVGIEGPGADTSGLGYTELGARYRVAHGDGWVASVQGTARIPGKKRTDSLAKVGSTDAEYDFRALVGKGFKLGQTDAFVDLQGGYRLRAGDPPNEYHADVTLGVRPAKKLQVIGQLFNTFSDGAGQGVFNSYRYHNAYLSAVYDIDDHLSFQIGGLATLGGKNALRERGVITGLWYRF